MTRTTIKKFLKTLNKTLNVFMLTSILLVLIAGLRIILELLFGVKMAAIVVFALMFVCIFVLNFLKGGWDNTKIKLGRNSNDNKIIKITG